MLIMRRQGSGRATPPEPRAGRRLLATFTVAAWTLLAVYALGGLVAGGSAAALDPLLGPVQAGSRGRGGGAAPGWLVEAVRDLTALGSNAVLALLVVVAASWLAAARKGGEAAMLLVTFAGALVLVAILKLAIARPRPDLAAAAAVFTSSLPSSHAAASAAVYPFLGVLAARAARDGPATVAIASALALPILVGASRIWLGVHWPSDVLAGWAVGATWSLLCLAALDRYGSTAAPDRA